VFGVAVALAGAVGLALPRLRVNLSPSLPRGLFWLAAAGGARPGDLVLACPPQGFARLALARHYLAPGPCRGGSRPLGKLLLAAPGDRLELRGAAVVLDGWPLPATATRAADAAGRPLPRMRPGARRVRPGEAWLLSPHPLSLDSRYFGPVSAADLLGRLVPLLTAAGADPAPLARAIRRARGAARDR
jgi:conjugative transfer signal peptidase TraF